MKILFITSSLVFLFSSCYSYKIFPKEYRNFTYTGQKKKAFVINPQSSRELKILEKSGIFELTTDSLDNAAVKIRLHSIKPDLACGQPVLLSFVTVGQLPVLLPDRYQYTFDEIHYADTVQKKFELKIATRYWFWDLLAVNKKFDQKAGQTLLAGYYNQ